MPQASLATGSQPVFDTATFYCHAQIALVIYRFLKQNLLQLRPELITEHQSGHRKLVLLVVWEPQYYEFASIYEILISKRQQTLAFLSVTSEKNFYMERALVFLASSKPAELGYKQPSSSKFFPYGIALKPIFIAFIEVPQVRLIKTLK